MYQLSQKEYKRDYNIDLIRIVSMFLVLSLHCMYYGGLYHKSYEMGGAINIYSVWYTILHSISSISVNLFVLISGYHLYNKRFKVSKLIRIISKVVFYSWTIFAFRLYFAGTEDLTLKMVVTALLPVSYVQYWFVSAYVALYILSPVLNLFIRSINQRQHFGVMVVLVCLFSLMNTILPLSQVMGVRRFGQSLSWFVTLYMIGAYIRMYIGTKTRRKDSLRCFWIAIVIMNVYWLIASSMADILDYDLHNEKIGTMVKYYFMFDSVPVLIASVCAFQWFRGIEITNPNFKAIIRRITPFIFGVYLIHCNYYIMSLVWIGVKNLDMNPFMPIYSLLYTIALYMVCIVIDYLRSLICTLIMGGSSLKKVLEAHDEKLYMLFDKAYCYFLKLIK